MLILRRKAGESLLVGGNIRITVSEIDGDGVRLAIDAPRSVTILRQELVEAAAANKAAAANREKMDRLKGILREEVHPGKMS